MPAWDKDGEDIADAHTYYIKVSAPYFGVLEAGMLQRLRNYAFAIGPQCTLSSKGPQCTRSEKPVLEATGVPKTDLMKVAKAHCNLQLTTWRPLEVERRRKRTEAKAARSDKMQYCPCCSCEGCAAKRQKL